MNVRPLGPECRNACKIKAFSCFLVLSCRNKNLFRTFRHTVSVQSEAVDGQRCGQIRIYHPSDSLKSFKTLRLLQPLYHKNSKNSRDMAQNLHRCNQRLQEPSNPDPRLSKQIRRLIFPPTVNRYAYFRIVKISIYAYFRIVEISIYAYFWRWI